MIFLVKINVNHSTRVMFVQYSFGTEAHTPEHFTVLTQHCTSAVCTRTGPLSGRCIVKCYSL